MVIQKLNKLYYKSEQVWVQVITIFRIENRENKFRTTSYNNYTNDLEKNVKDLVIKVMRKNSLKNTRNTYET